MKYLQGGLMRCCTETLRDAEARGALAYKEEIHCYYCDHRMVLNTEHGVWMSERNPNAQGQDKEEKE